MKKLKKLASLLLTVFLLSASLASCKQNITTPNESSTANTPSAPNESSQPLAPIEPVPFASQTVKLDTETGLPILPTRAERANESYVRSHPGGMDWSYEELASMTPDDINQKLMQPAFNQYKYFTGLGDLNYASAEGNPCTVYNFWDCEEQREWQMYAVDDERFPTYESFVCETRKYFSPDLAAQYFAENYFFEYGEVFYDVGGARGSDISFCDITFTILSSTETEIEYSGVARYYLHEEDWGTYPETSLADYRFEFRYFNYTLSLQDGRWVFTQFTLPY